MINLFIDTNGFLNFYRYSSDDLEELRKLETAVRIQKIRLYSTTHQKDEFRRNREGVIAQSLKSLKEASLPKQFPQLARNYETYIELRAALKTCSELLSQITQQIETEARDRKLQADELVDALFDLADVIDVGEADYERARRRFDLGNPPGKNGSYGDALNWLALLDHAPVSQELVLITADADFVSKVNSDRLSEFLDEEWQRVKKSSVELHPSLTSFFKRHFPEIKLASEMEKESAILELVGSDNFSTTHAAIAKLVTFDDFSPQQAHTLFQAALSNSQIKWIGKDDDVRGFFEPLAAEYRDMLTGDDLAQFREHFAIEQQ